MSHVVVANYLPNSTTEVFQGIWKLTRAMLAAGWRYKASADATGTSSTKDTSSNPANDKWAVGGGVNYAQVGAQAGTAPVIGAPSAGVSVVTGVSGFTANSVGRFLVITGAVNSANNGIFRITAQAGTTVSIFNPGAVSETTPGTATWKEVQGGAAASVATAGTSGAYPGRAIVSGLTGMVAPTTSPLNRGSAGDHLTIIGAANSANNGTFRITRVLSTTQVEIDNPSAVTDGNNGSIIWVESSPLAQAYPASLQGGTGTGAWLVLQGPSTMKIPIGTNVPTGIFVRGEKVTQTNSGATGRLLGVCTDTVTGLGFVVIQPYVNGTGGGARGWTTGGTDTLTGAISGATITTANITPVEYVREIVFWKNTQANGHIFAQVVDQSGESAYRFSTIAATAPITNVLAPGSGTSFPTPGSFTVIGTGNSAAASTGSVAWGQCTSPTGQVQLLCANCLEDASNEADGSWIWAHGTPANASYSYAGMYFMRCDDSEEGDVDPYIYSSYDTASYGMNRLVNTSASPTQDFFGAGTTSHVPATLLSHFRGWRRRGFPTGDAFQEFSGACLFGVNTTATYGIGRVQHATQELMIKEPVWYVSVNPTQRMRKGTARWVFFTEGGVSNMTYASGQWVQLGTGLLNPLICGPWDGQTTPANA